MENGLATECFWDSNANQLNGRKKGKMICLFEYIMHRPYIERIDCKHESMRKTTIKDVLHSTYVIIPL